MPLWRRRTGGSPVTSDGLSDSTVLSMLTLAGRCAPSPAKHAMSDAGGGGVGESRLGEFAREQIEKARNDPRLTRGRGAAVGDYWEAMEEAEQTRMLSVLGLYELSGVLERYEREHGVSRDDANLDPARQGEMQALWEQAELASAAIATDFAAVNAQALLDMNSALDAMVEEFAPAMRELAVGGMADQLMRAAEEASPEAAGELDDENRGVLKEALVRTLDERLRSSTG